MSNKSVMGIGQAHELDLALARNGWTADDVKALSEGDRLALHLKVLRGQATVIPLPEPSDVSGHGPYRDTSAVRAWHECDGVIYFSVTSDGTDGAGWIARLEAKGFRVDRYAKEVLRSPNFVPTIGVTYEIAVLKCELFADDDRTTANIRTEARRRWMSAPHAEIDCLTRENFSDADLAEMGLVWLVTMHEPIKGSDGNSGLLCGGLNDVGRWLNVNYVRPNTRWCSNGGFAFVAPKVSCPYR